MLENFVEIKSNSTFVRSLSIIIATSLNGEYPNKDIFEHYEGDDEEEFEELNKVVSTLSSSFQQGPNSLKCIFNVLKVL